MPTPRRRKTNPPRRNSARFGGEGNTRPRAYVKLANAKAMLDEHIEIAKIWKKKMNGNSDPKIKKELLGIMASAQKYLRVINADRVRNGKNAILIENLFPPIKRR